MADVDNLANAGAGAPAAEAIILVDQQAPPAGNGQAVVRDQADQLPANREALQRRIEVLEAAKLQRKVRQLELEESRFDEELDHRDEGPWDWDYDEVTLVRIQLLSSDSYEPLGLGLGRL